MEVFNAQFCVLGNPKDKNMSKIPESRVVVVHTNLVRGRCGLGCDGFVRSGN